MINRHGNLARATNRLDWTAVEDTLVDTDERSKSAMRELMSIIPLFEDWEVFFGLRSRAPPVKGDIRVRLLRRKGRKRQGRWVGPGKSSLCEVWDVNE